MRQSTNISRRGYGLVFAYVRARPALPRWRLPCSKSHPCTGSHHHITSGDRQHQRLLSPSGFGTETPRAINGLPAFFSAGSPRRPRHAQFGFQHHDRVWLPEQRFGRQISGTRRRVFRGVITYGELAAVIQGGGFASNNKTSRHVHPECSPLFFALLQHGNRVMKK